MLAVDDIFPVFALIDVGFIEFGVNKRFYSFISGGFNFCRLKATKIGVENFCGL